RPNIGLDAQQHISCGSVSLQANLKYKYADTIYIKWGDGNDTLLYTNNKSSVDSIPLSHQYQVAGQYVASCKAWNSSCYDSVAYSNIVVDSIPTIGFKVNQVATCAGDSITLTDTAGYTQTISSRKWQLSSANGYDTAITQLAPSFVFILTQAGNYNIKETITSRQGCIDSLEKLNYIQVRANPKAMITGGTQLCGADTLKLSASAGVTYEWSTGDTVNQIKVYVVQSGAYQVVITQANGCVSSDSLYITVNAQPKAAFQANYLASCGASTFTFIDTSSTNSINYYRYWHIQNPKLDTINSTTGNNLLSINLQDTGYYHITLKVVTQQGCVDSINKQKYIRVNAIPDASITPNGKVSICFNDSVKLNLPLNSRYLWNTSDTTQFIYIKKQGNYSATVWNEYNCFAKSATVTASVLAPFNPVIKQGVSKDSLYIQVNRKLLSYQWLRDGQSFAGNTMPSIYPAVNGKYTCSVTDSFGCVGNTNTIIINLGLETIIESPLNIYPNPTAGQLTIEHISPQITYIQLYDLAGKVIKTEPTQGATTLHLSLKEFSSGIYILQAGTYRVKVLVEN
ncbi:MAG: T9SS type A sorting domain-containing protein, partial [Bacteroidetes bacterium]|nr:T9SS type A sorting domain-containing protein [Bacteroidota bacterium]